MVDAMKAHEFVTVKDRRWCLGCDLFQTKSQGAVFFPTPRNACPRDTPRARQQLTPCIAQDFGDMIAYGQQRQRLIREYPGFLKALAMSVADLRALWDSIDDSGSTETSDPEIPGETVHFVLNEKGDGHYCAI
jgi:hypothetical protein